MTHSLGKRYGDFPAVRDLSLTVERGEVYGFLGPNGAGKTTTIRMLMGILVPTSGRAAIDGLDCHDDRVEVKRRVGYLPDSPAFYDFLRGREILEFVGEMHGLGRAGARRRAGALFEELALGDAAEEYAVNYSAGMKKKLGLACALVHEPDCLILDEPTTGLDPRAAREVEERLRASARGGRTIFLSTHLLDRAERLCSCVGIIDRGRLVAGGPLDELRDRIVPGGSLEGIFLKVTDHERAEEGGGPASSRAAGAAGPTGPAGRAGDAGARDGAAKDDGRPSGPPPGSGEPEAGDE